MQSRIQYGMVGGGEGAFIGEIHRIAARLDNHYELVAGALCSEAERSIRSAKKLGISADRSYIDYTFPTPMTAHTESTLLMTTPPPALITATFTSWLRSQRLRFLPKRRPLILTPTRTFSSLPSSPWSFLPPDSL